LSPGANATVTVHVGEKVGRLRQQGQRLLEYPRLEDGGNSSKIKVHVRTTESGLLICNRRPFSRANIPVLLGTALRAGASAATTGAKGGDVDADTSGCGVGDGDAPPSPAPE
jgi:hypothetical protein